MDGNGDIDHDGGDCVIYTGHEEDKLSEFSDVLGSDSHLFFWEFPGLRAPGASNPCLDCSRGEA